jgi:triosephosphate isomerase
MRTIIIAGNWKMNCDRKEAAALASGLRDAIGSVTEVEAVLCPPFTDLTTVADAIKGSTIDLGAQNVYWEAPGAFTGEISTGFLKEVGCAYCIVGHSERRQYFGETDETVNRRAKALYEAGIKPIICVGELLEERESGKTMDVVLGQLRGCFAGITADQARETVVAYEPVWAIGTGKVATPEQAQDVHAAIRAELAGLYDQSVADAIRIQYGGSMKPENADELLAKPDIDGGLIGGAALKVDSFAGLIEAAKRVGKRAE